MRKILATLSWLIVFLGIFLIFTNGITDADFWWHLKTGEVILQTRSIPHTDIFSHTAADRPWTNHEWPTQVLFFSVYRLFGFQGVIFFTAFLGTLAFAILSLILKKNRIPAPVSQTSLVLAAAAVSPFMIPRPQLFYFVLWTVLMFLLDRYRSGSRKGVFWIPLLFFIWANVHASAQLMVLLIALYLSAEVVVVAGPKTNWFKAHRGLLAATVIGLLVGIINVNGIAAYTYVLKALPFQKSPDSVPITEWGSFLREYQAWQTWFLLVFYGIVVVSFLLTLRKAQARTVREGLLVFCFIVFSLINSKFVPLAVLLALPFLAKNLQERVHFKSEKISLLLTALLFLSAVGYHNFLGRPLGQTTIEVFPDKAAQFILDQRIPGNLYNTYNFGGFLIWKLYPEYKDYVDGRHEMFDPDVMEDFRRMLDGDLDWEESLNKFSVNLLILPPREVHPGLAESEDWILVYVDNLAAVFVKNDPLNRRVIDQFGYRTIRPFAASPDYTREEQNLAISEYLRSLENDPDIFKSHYDLGMIYLGREDYAQAEVHLREALRIFPESDLSRANLEVALEKQGKSE